MLLGHIAGFHTIRYTGSDLSTDDIESYEIMILVKQLKKTRSSPVLKTSVACHWHIF